MAELAFARPAGNGRPTQRALERLLCDLADFVEIRGDQRSDRARELFGGTGSHEHRFAPGIGLINPRVNGYHKSTQLVKLGIVKLDQRVDRKGHCRAPTR